MQNDENMVGQLVGLITERELGLAELEFPGLSRFYAECRERPRTFLELVTRFGAFQPAR